VVDRAPVRLATKLEGINDLGACLVSADQVIQGYKDVVERLHAKGIKILSMDVRRRLIIAIHSNDDPEKARDFQHGVLLDVGRFSAE
jgi:hypothetical protein